MTQKLTITFLLGLLLVSCSSLNSSNDPKRAKAEIFYTYGTEMLIAGKYTDALENLLQAVELTPNDPLIHNNLAMAYFYKQQTAKAKYHLNVALDLNPKNSDARHNLASIYFDQGQLELAELEYKKVEKDLIYKMQYSTYYNLALIELRRANTFAAITYLNKAITENNNYCPAHHKLGDIAKENQDYSKAYKHYRNATMGTCYSNTLAHYEQAKALVKLHNFEQAKNKFLEIKEKFPLTEYAQLVNSDLNQLKRVQANASLISSGDESRSELKINNKYSTPKF